MYDRFQWSGVSNRRNMATAEYEPIQPYYLMALAEQAKARTFLDIGSNIGAYSVFASLIPSVERIIAFEANPHAAKEIMANAKLNGLEIEVVKKALSSKDGMASFSLVSTYAGNNGIDVNVLDPHKRIIVETIPLDSMELDGPLCLKIDVEGHELPVIQGALDTLRLNKCVVQMEGYDNKAAKKLMSLGYSKLTRIGPDDYFTNMKLSAIEAYELAASRMIADNHRAKAVTMKRGDFALTITGRAAETARSVAKRIMGNRL